MPVDKVFYRADKQRGIIARYVVTVNSASDMPTDIYGWTSKRNRRVLQPGVRLKEWAAQYPGTVRIKLFPYDREFRVDIWHDHAVAIDFRMKFT